MTGKQYSTSLYPFLWLLHSFRSLFRKVPWALEGVIQMSHLGLSIPKSLWFLTIYVWASFFTNCCCPEQRGASLTKANSSMDLWAWTQAHEKHLMSTSYWNIRRNSPNSCLWPPPAWAFDQVCSTDVDSLQWSGPQIHSESARKAVEPFPSFRLQGIKDFDTENID